MSISEAIQSTNPVPFLVAFICYTIVALIDYYIWPDAKKPEGEEEEQ